MALTSTLERRNQGQRCEGLEAFECVRPRLFAVAYRMLGRAADAEDVLQDVWLRWDGCDRAAVRDASAYLMTTTTRLCINVLQSAHVRRESCVGPALPEPRDTGAAADPTVGAERAEALQVATVLLLDRLSPAERAAYILREAFDYPYDLIAQAIGVTDVNARQLVSRARRHLTANRAEPERPTNPQPLVMAIITAAQTGEMAPLERMLACATR